MAAAPLPPIEFSEPQRLPRRTRGRKSVAAVLLLVLALGVIAVLCIRAWPFDEATMLRRLQEASDSQLQVRSYRHTYFPHPGCVLEDAVFRRGNGSPLITIGELTIESTYLGMIRHHLSRIVADRMRVMIPTSAEGHPFHVRPWDFTIGEVLVREGTLEFARKSTPEPLRFDVHELSLRGVGWTAPVTYQVKMHNPSPPADITASGKFGVWNLKDAALTPLSGEYKMERADLGIYRGIAGILTAAGKFQGTLGHIDVNGTTDVPDFRVRMSDHTVELITNFDAYVNGTNGDTVLKRVDAYFRKTHVVAEGRVAKDPADGGKTATIHLSSRDGRIEDVLWLFVKGKQPPMTGVVNLQTNVEIPHGKRRFLEKVKLQGEFGITRGEFPNGSTQVGVNRLSAGAQGQDDEIRPQTALTNLSGAVGLDNGIATFHDLTFEVPGAKAQIRGTYGVMDHQIDLRGQMKVDTAIANTTSGAKSFLLRLMGPFFKKRKHGGQILPVKIAGTYEKPTFGLALGDKKAQEVPSPHTHRGAHRRG